MGPKTQLSHDLAVLSQMRDEQLMQMVKGGDQMAFRELYERYKGPVMGYVLGMLRQRSVAQEVAQDVFLKLYRSRETYEVKAKFTTFLWTLAKHTAIDSLRKKKELLMGDYPSHDEEQGSDWDIADHNAHIEEQLILRCERQLLLEAINELSLNQREAMSLRIHSELSHEEMASAMGTTVSAVKSLIKRAKDNLMIKIQNKMQEDKVN